MFRPTPRRSTCPASRSPITRATARFETFLRLHGLADPALVEIGRIIHEADLADERFDAPEARGLDVLIRGLSMTLGDEAVLEVTGPLFDGLYAFKQRAQMLGREPA